VITFVRKDSFHSVSFVQDSVATKAIRELIGKAVEVYSVIPSLSIVLEGIIGGDHSGCPCARFAM